MTAFVVIVHLAISTRETSSLEMHMQFWTFLPVVTSPQVILVLVTSFWVTLTSVILSWAILSLATEFGAISFLEIYFGAISSRGTSFAVMCCW